MRSDETREAFPTMKAQCMTCQFWERYKEPSGSACGFCLRFPPVPVARVESDSDGISSNVASEWPETRSNEWCGEYRKDEPDPADYGPCAPGNSVDCRP